MFKQIIAVVFMSVFVVSMAHAQTSFFTYQGTLADAGGPADGLYDMQFWLYDDITPGAPDNLLGTYGVLSVEVAAGLFATDISFGVDDINSFSNLYIEIHVRPSGPDPYTTLVPRQEITSTPRAIRSLHAAQALSLALPFYGTGEPDKFSDVTFEITDSGTTGTAILGRGHTAGIFGIADNPTNPHPGFVLGSGVVGLSSAAGVVGISDDGDGVVGKSSTGTGGVFETRGSSVAEYALKAQSTRGSTAGLFDVSDIDDVGQPALIAQTDSTENFVHAMRGIIQTTEAAFMSAGVKGINNSSSQESAGVWGDHQSNGYGVYGTSNTGVALYARSQTGMAGFFRTDSVFQPAILALGADTGSAGQFETPEAASFSPTILVRSQSEQPSTFAVHGMMQSDNPGGFSAAVRGENKGTGILGIGVWGSHDGSGWGVYGTSVSGEAGYFNGNVTVTGNLSKAGGSFKIDHPQDPANRYLSHSFVESPDMKNIYDGVITLGADGRAVVALPSYFEALNQEFRYQLTCVGGYAPVYISSEIANQAFAIAGGHEGLKVSWQVTGVRHDAWADQNRIVVEEEKSSEDQGRYLNPEAFGKPKEDGVGYQKAQQGQN